MRIDYLNTSWARGGGGGVEMIVRAVIMPLFWILSVFPWDLYLTTVENTYQSTNSALPPRGAILNLNKQAKIPHSQFPNTD